MSEFPICFRLLRVVTVACTLQLCASPTIAADLTKPIVSPDLVFAEKGGLVAVEAEHFVSQSSTEKRAFHITSSNEVPQLTPDADPPHLAGASGGAYVEVLPDSRRNHSEKLIHGENFSGEPGKLAVLTYHVHFATPGRYYVWARAFSTGPEDNGLHVGIDGSWPDSGQRMQWCDGKRTWRWESKQRTEAEHCGEPHKIFLDVMTTGVHKIHFSMREDGFEFDRWLMTAERDMQRPDGIGPDCGVYAGERPEPFAWVDPATAADNQNEPSPLSQPVRAEPQVQPRGEDGDGAEKVGKKGRPGKRPAFVPLGESGNACGGGVKEIAHFCSR